MTKVCEGRLILLAVFLLALGVIVNSYAGGDSNVTRVADADTVRPANSLDPMRFPISQEWAVRYGKSDQSQRDYNDWELRQSFIRQQRNLKALGDTVTELLEMHDPNGSHYEGDQAILKRIIAGEAMIRAWKESYDPNNSHYEEELEQ